MAIEINPSAHEQVKYLLDTYLKEELDIEISEFKLDLFATHCTQAIAPVVYNAAIKDAQTYLFEKLTDMEADLYADERKA